ncbi:uncharacterized protein AMSG_02865 [Thecamonas trahens ATCC 50062]|uniref:CCDC81 HU domain-containing protein n=1 Tax=Thecamonas trahens ATCC 50062 TaxID=461836 RepID=A0A0L0D2L2_THETB|nr:hypothetical protein AMSG_02865 [Thecamonas trahens ATCC 50062]KNC46410.1 hypothetical protein AMSG_02865 [Thecamonas trahens ATCC 50062]|eukprot:XP_013760703.1 hypothetical protein AMSG_02865 [Thecamonas trahens ATCC 50062]
MNTGDLIQACVKSPYGLTGLSAEEMGAVWRGIGQFVAGGMAQGKGVVVPGLGQFTFSAASTDLGNSVKHRAAPAFYLNERFARTHGVRSKKAHPTSRIPQVSLNLAAVARRTGSSREAVSAVLKDVLVAVADAIHVRKPVTLDVGVGRLLFRGGSAVMKWSPQVVEQCRALGKRATTKARPMTASAALARSRSRGSRAGASIRTGSSRPASAQSSPRGGGAPPQSVRFDGSAGRRRPSSSASSQGGSSMFEAQAPPVRPMSGTVRPPVEATDANDPGGVLLDRPPAEGTWVAGTSVAPASLAKTRRRTIEQGEGDDEVYDYDRVEEARRNYREALAAKRVVQMKEDAMDEHIRATLAADAAEAAAKDAAEAAERRAEEERIRKLNQQMAAERARTRELMRQSERAFEEKPIFGDRPATPPPAMKANEYSLLLEEQINYRNARKRQAIEEEMAYAAVTQTIVDSELDRADEEYEAELARKKAATAATLKMQMELTQKARLEEARANALAPALCIIPMKESETKAAQQASTRKLFTDQMALIAQRKAAKAAQDARDTENERQQLAKLSTERFASTMADHERRMAKRRQLEETWKIQIDQKKALAAEEGTDIPRNTSLPLKRRPMRRSGRKNVVQRRYRLQTGLGF